MLRLPVGCIKQILTIINEPLKQCVKGSGNSDMFLLCVSEGGALYLIDRFIMKVLSAPYLVSMQQRDIKIVSFNDGCIRYRFDSDTYPNYNSLFINEFTLFYLTLMEDTLYKQWIMEYVNLLSLNLSLNKFCECYYYTDDYDGIETYIKTIKEWGLFQVIRKKKKTYYTVLLNIISGVTNA